MKKNKALEIDMIAGSQLRDTQGEMLSIEGADISDLERGLGKLNDNHGKGAFNSIGRITGAKKIMKEEDCTNPRHKYYWDKVKAPYIYVSGILYNDEDHPNARAAAAIVRHIHKADVPLKMKASVEGGVISRGIADPTLLARTKIHSVALTLTPANQATLIEPINLDKSQYDEASDYLLIKSVQHLAETNVPSFRAVQKAASAAKVAKNIRMIQKLLKKAKEEQELEKGIKEAAIGAAALASAAFPDHASANPSIQPSTQPSIQQAAPSPVDVVNSLKGKRPILHSLAVQESSGGRNLKHETLAGGQHKGMTAGGPWGMMPKTAAYVLTLNKKLGSKYPKMAEAVKDLNNNHKDITKMLNENPVMAQEFADSLLGHLRKVHGEKNMNKVIHSWHYGIKGTNTASASGENLDENEYVKLIRGHLNRLSPQKQKKMSKALTAGYGGAGAPTSRVGGSVMMTEELDAGRGFKYITCNQCGDEQIYAKHQVKCRKCNSSFPFAKIANLVVK